MNKYWRDVINLLYYEHILGNSSIFKFSFSQFDATSLKYAIEFASISDI